MYAVLVENLRKSLDLIVFPFRNDPVSIPRNLLQLDRSFIIDNSANLIARGQFFELIDAAFALLFFKFSIKIHLLPLQFFNGSGNKRTLDLNIGRLISEILLAHSSIK